MNYQIADAKTRFFDDKEHYLNFLRAWKKAAQRSQKKGEDWGCLKGEHMFFYALVRGRNVYEAFTPVHKETKLRNGFYINQGMYFAYQGLKSLARWAQQDSEWTKRYIDEFLAPFDGTIDKDRMVKIIEQLPELKPIYSNYGKGMRAAEALIENTKEGNLWDIVDQAMNQKEAA